MLHRGGKEMGPRAALSCGGYDSVTNRAEITAIFVGATIHQ